MSPLPQGKYPYLNVPGKARLTVVIIPEGIQDPFIVLDGAIKPLHFQLLEDLRTFLGGDEGYLTDPFACQPLHVSLKAFADADPKQTRVVLGWQFNPKLPVAEMHQHLFEDWVLHLDRYTAGTVRLTWHEEEAGQSRVAILTTTLPLTRPGYAAAVTARHAVKRSASVCR